MVKAGAKFPLVVGIDEVGVGALAGPVTVTAVALKADVELAHYKDLKDSKLLTPRRREQLAEIIVATAFGGVTHSATAEEIDELGIAKARDRCVVECFERLRHFFREYSVSAVVDGRALRNSSLPRTALYVDKADQKSRSVAAASIVAKVTRDRAMAVFDKAYPGYELARNKGYFSLAHVQRLAQAGPTPIHRRTFDPLKSLLAGKTLGEINPIWGIIEQECNDVQKTDGA